MKIIKPIPNISLILQIQIDQQHQINQPQHHNGGKRHLVVERMEYFSHIHQLVVAFQDHRRVD